jgi:hypothetical protein
MFSRFGNLSEAASVSLRNAGHDLSRLTGNCGFRSVEIQPLAAADQAGIASK